MASLAVRSPRQRTSDWAPWPAHEPDEIEAVTRVLQSGRTNYWTGTEAREFETEFARFAGTRRAIALFNGSVAIELALEALNIRCGDEMVTTPRTFMASASSAAIRGIKPIFVDVDRDSGNITPESVARAITPRTRAILAVHLAGWPCDMDGLRTLAKDRGIALIEDCAQAHGATINGQSVGGLGDAAAWSFCQDKIMTTGGEGGALTVNDEAAYRRAWSYKDHGKSYEAVHEREHAPGFRWLHETLGTNWRMTEIQAAIGRRQLLKMPDWTRTRRAHWNTLANSLDGLDGLRVPRPEPKFGHAAYKFYAYVRPEALRPDWTRDRIMSAIAERGVPCYSGSCSEVYRERAWDGLGIRPDSSLPVAQELGETSLMLLVHPTLSPQAVGEAGEIARAVIEEATR